MALPSCPCLFFAVFETCLCVKGLSIGSQVEITSELAGPGWDVTASEAGVTLSALHDQGTKTRCTHERRKGVTGAENDLTNG